MNNPLNVGNLIAFLTIAEQGSINRASKVMHVSQPALTRTLRELETTIGGALFERNAKGVSITPLGERLIGHARAIRAETQNAVRSIESFQQGESTHIHLGTTGVFMLDLFALALLEVMAENPTVRMHTMSGTLDELITALQAGRIEMILGQLSGFDGTEFLIKDVIHHDTMALFCRPGNPLAQLRKVSIEKLRDARWTLGPPGSLVHTRVRQLFESEGLTLPEVALEVDSIPLRRSVVIHSDCISAFQSYHVHHEVQAGRIAQLKYEWPQDQRPMGAVRIRPHSTLSKRIVDAIRSQYRQAGLPVK
jgi:DNA-binding transcriptional LysR family regulator